MMLELRCPFCHLTHRSEFYDEIEESVMRCRDLAPRWKRGDLVDFKRENVTIPLIIPEQEYAAYI